MNDSTNQGWVRFYRKSIHSSVFKNPNIWMVWSWCLMKANHQMNEFPFNGTDTILKKGQFITGRNKALLELPLTPQKYRTAIKYLKSTNRITIKSTNQFSLISVVKWEDYQQDNQRITNKQPTDNQRITNKQPTDNQRITTNKNDKNEKNEKKKILSGKPDKELTQDYINSNKRKDIRIILLYARAKGKQKWSSDEESSFIKRNLRSAKLLEAYSYERIIEVMKYLNENADFKWGVETIGKFIDEDLTKLNNRATCSIK